jgi:hypothetical protein
MQTKVKIKGLQKAQGLLDIFIAANVRRPKTDLYRALVVHEPNIRQEVAMLIRLAMLRSADVRRKLIPMSFKAAMNYFDSFRATGLEEAGERWERLEAMNSVIERLKQLPVGREAMVSKFEGVLNDTGSAHDVEDLWMLRVIAAEQLVADAVKIESDHDQISRSIVLDAAVRQPAVDLFAYFSEVVRTKYPGMDVKIGIELYGSVVALHIDMPAGLRDVISQELTEYGHAVTRQTSFSDYMPDRLSALRLEHKVEAAEMELRHTRELLASERENHRSEVSYLKAQVETIRSVLDSTQYEAAQLSYALRQIALDGTKATAEFVTQLQEILASNAVDKEQQLADTIRRATDENPTILERLHDLLIRGAIQGAAGNYLYAAIQAISVAGPR